MTVTRINNMPIEFEYKYVVERIPDEYATPISVNTLEQFYVVNDRERKMSTRGRMTTNEKGTIYRVTHKIGSSPAVMETEYVVDKDIYDELKENFLIGSIITKYRTVVEIEGNIWDIDVYNNGLVIAEIEDPPKYMIVPKAFGKYKDVTHDFAYKNVSMALNGMPDHTDVLK
jgi:CYTH domain-containing protein